MPPAITQQLVFVYSEEPARSIAFYRDVLGLEEVLDQDGQCRIFRVAGEAFLGICKTRPGRSVTEDGVVISFVTDEVDAWYQRLRDRGAAVLGPPSESETFKVYSFFAHDPDGHTIEFQRFLNDDWPAAGAAQD